MTLTKKLIEQWVRPEIRALHAYHVPDARDMIKLDAMENPYTWPAYLRGDWVEMLQDVSVNRYPDPSARALKDRLRDVYAIDDQFEILLGNGSDEIIQLIAMAVAAPGRKVLAPEPAFVMYRMIAGFVGMDYVGVPLRAEDFTLDMPAMLAAIKQHQPAVVFLAYPNNPTGNLFGEDEIIQIIEASPGLVVVDEAYTPFAQVSFLPHLANYENLLVMRTLSKLGLAGLRLGFLVGARGWLEQFDKLRLPYNINTLTQVSAEFALTYADVFDGQTEQIREDRERLAQALAQLPGLQVFPSASNFILFRAPAGRGRAMFEAIKADGILIKNLDGGSPLLHDCLRVTVGKPAENRAFIAALGRALGV